MIINSLLDSDFYKFSMMEAVLHQYSGSMIRYVFKWRNSECMKLRIPVKDFIGRLKRELDHLCSLRFKNEINVSFGIGTYLTNDCGFEAPQIVMKPVECNGRPVAKISDSVGKGMCEDPEFQDYLMKVIREKIAG